MVTLRFHSLGMSCPICRIIEHFTVQKLINFEGMGTHNLLDFLELLSVFQGFPGQDRRWGVAVFGRVVSEKSVCQHFDKYAAKANCPQNGCKKESQKFHPKNFGRLLDPVFEPSASQIETSPKQPVSQNWDLQPVFWENQLLRGPLKKFMAWQAPLFAS